MMKRWRNGCGVVGGEKHKIILTVGRWKEATQRRACPSLLGVIFLLCIQTSYNLNAREMTRRLHSVKFRLYHSSLDWRAKRLE